MAANYDAMTAEQLTQHIAQLKQQKAAQMQAQPMNYDAMSADQLRQHISELKQQKMAQMQAQAQPQPPQAAARTAQPQQEKVNPSFLFPLVSNQELSGAEQQIASNPARAAKVIGGSILNTAQGLIREAGSGLGYNSLGDKVNKIPNVDFGKNLGIGKARAGDELLASLPLSAAPELLETKGLSALTRIGARGIEGASYNKASGGDADTGALLAGLTGTAFEAPAAIGNKTRNIILNRLNKSAEKGNALSPQETATNVLRNYIGPEGSPLPVDIGTATDNPGLRGLYQVSSALPFSGSQAALTKKGARETNLVKAQYARDKALQEAQAELSQGLAVQGQESAAKQELIPKLSSINERMQALGASISESRQALNQVPDYVNSLSLKGEGTQGQQIKSALSKAFKEKKAESRALYDGVNNSDISLANISSPQDFVNYQASLDKFKNESGDLSAMFGNDKDLGAKLSSELEKGGKFFGGGNTTDSVLYLPSPYRSISGGSSISSILTHAKNLQKLGASAISAGNNREGSALFNIAGSLKDDLKNVLVKNGHEDVAKSLEAADLHHQSNILPYYQNPEIRKTVLNKGYEPDTGKISKALYSPNQAAILQHLPTDAQNAVLFHLITKGKATKESRFTPEQIGKSYESISGQSKEILAQMNPDMDRYLRSISETAQGIKDKENMYKSLNREYSLNSKLLNQKEKSTSAITTAQQKIDKASQDYNDFIKSTLPKLELKRESVVANIAKSFPALKAGLLGYAAYAHPSVAIPAIGIGSAAARPLNKVLTDQNLIASYISGQKFSSKDRAIGEREKMLLRILRNPPQQAENQ